ncbi:hypothetical protein ACP70R_037797 [Stipagrostis hirtigluma subsp. patula]
MEKKIAPPILSLSEDLLLEIFLRLPSLATLVRAALTCRPWRRAVASSPDFRRRFRALHPAPLLGHFFEAPSPTQVPNIPAFPTFSPTRPHDRDLVAAVRGGNFFLTTLQVGAGESPCWDIVDCCHGYVLLMNWDDQLLVVMNPFTKRCEKPFALGSKNTFLGCHGTTVQLNARLLCSDEDPMTFRVVILAHDKSRVRATVFSSDTRKWSIHPWVKVPAPWRSDDSDRWLVNEGGMQANGFLYWQYCYPTYLISLDTTAMKFSAAELPQCLKSSSSTFDVGGTKDGAACVAYADGLNVGVLLQTRNDDGVERWVLDRSVHLGRELKRVLRGGLDDDIILLSSVDNPSELIVLAVRDGYVFLATSWMYHDSIKPCWFLSLCLETMQLERLFRRTFDNGVHPYIMAWPPSLVGNYGGFACEDGR